jgi:acetoacetate decarboxylase
MYRDAQYLSATVEVDPTAMRRFLPAGVRLAKPGRADLFLAHFPDNPFTPGYLEAGLFVHVRTARGSGIHCPWMLVNDDAALILGREVTGYPKKLGSISWRHEGDTIRAAASRHGTELVGMEARLGEPVPPTPFLGRPHRNVSTGIGLRLPFIHAFTPREVVREVRDVDVDLTLGGSVRDPLLEMGLGDVLHARLHRVDLAAGLVPPIPLRPTSPTFLIRHLNTRVL